MKTQPLDFVLSSACLAAIGALAWAATIFLFAPMSRAAFGEYHVILDAIFLLLAFGVLAALVVRALIRLWPLVPGSYSMDEALFTRWKLVAVLSEYGRLALQPFTSEFSKPLMARLFGARIGQDTALGGRMADLSLISVESGCIFGINSVVTGHAITSGRIILREVRFGRGACIGVGVVVMPGVEVGEGAVVAAGSVVTLGTRIPPGELWAGTPARRVKQIETARAPGE